MSKLCRSAPHELKTFTVNATLLEDGLGLLLDGVSLLPGPAAAVSAAIQKILDQSGAVAQLASWINSFTDPSAPAAPVPTSPSSEVVTPDTATS